MFAFIRSSTLIIAIHCSAWRRTQLAINVSPIFHHGGRAARQFIPCYNTSHDLIFLHTECHGTYRCYYSISNIYAVYVRELLEKYRYLELMQSVIKADMFTYLNSPTCHATAVKQATIVVHGVTHTRTFIEYLNEHLKLHILTCK